MRAAYVFSINVVSGMHLDKMSTPPTMSVLEPKGGGGPRLRGGMQAGGVPVPAAAKRDVYNRGIRRLGCTVCGGALCAQ